MALAHQLGPKKDREVDKRINTRGQVILQCLLSFPLVLGHHLVRQVPTVLKDMLRVIQQKTIECAYIHTYGCTQASTVIFHTLIPSAPGSPTGPWLPGAPVTPRSPGRPGSPVSPYGNTHTHMDINQHQYINTIKELLNHQLNI